jgi:hypothetical protein
MGTEQEEASRRFVGNAEKEKRSPFWSSREAGSIGDDRVCVGKWPRGRSRIEKNKHLRGSDHVD